MRGVLASLVAEVSAFNHWSALSELNDNEAAAASKVVTLASAMKPGDSIDSKGESKIISDLPVAVDALVKLLDE